MVSSPSIVISSTTFSRVFLSFFRGFLSYYFPSCGILSYYSCILSCIVVSSSNIVVSSSTFAVYCPIIVVSYPIILVSCPNIVISCPNIVVSFSSICSFSYVLLFLVLHLGVLSFYCDSCSLVLVPCSLLSYPDTVFFLSYYVLLYTSSCCMYYKPVLGFCPVIEINYLYLTLMRWKEIL